MNPYRERALYKFRRYLFHELRNQEAAGAAPDMDDASTKAVWKTRDEMLDLMKHDTSFKTNIDREEAWADVLIDVMWMRQMLFDLPTVGVQIDVPKLKSVSASGNVTENFVEGVKSKLSKEEHDAKK